MVIRFLWAMIGAQCETSFISTKVELVRRLRGYGAHAEEACPGELAVAVLVAVEGEAVVAGRRRVAQARLVVGAAGTALAEGRDGAGGSVLDLPVAFEFSVEPRSQRQRWQRRNQSLATVGC